MTNSWKLLTKEFIFTTFIIIENNLFVSQFSRTQLTFVISKSTIETLEKGVKYVQS